MKKILSILMLATVMVACSHEEQPQLPEESSALKTYTMTIEATKGSDTRALGLVDNRLDAAWKKGETVAVLTPDLSSSAYHWMQIGELTAQSNGGSTILSGQLYGEPVMDELFFIYPRYPLEYTGQKGTLEDLAQRYDYSYQRTYPYNNFLTVNGEEITGSISNPFINVQAIVCFHLEKGSDDPLFATQLRIHDSSDQLVLVSYLASDDEVGDIIITPDEPSNEIWAAILKYSYSSSITLTATDVDNNTYTFTQDNVIWSNGQYYTVNVRMKQRHQVIFNPSEHGSVTVSPSEYFVAGDQNVVLTIHPDDLYLLDKLILTFNNDDWDATSTVSNNTCVIPSMPDGDVYVTATFKEVPLYHVTIDPNIEHGTVTASKEYYAYNEQVTLTITPDPGYELESILFDGSNFTGYVMSNTLSPAMRDHDVYVTATFKESTN